MTENIDQEFVPVTIGRRVWNVPVPMVFLCLERAQEGVEEAAAEARGQKRMIPMVGGALKVVAAALSITKGAPALQELKGTLLPGECDALLEAYFEIMRRSGFRPQESPAGEAEAAGPASDESPPS